MLWIRTLNGMMLQFIQQLNGQNFYCQFLSSSRYPHQIDIRFLDYYGDTFFQSAGTSLNPFVIQVILGGVSLAATIPALRLIETWGRRRVSPAIPAFDRILIAFPVFNPGGHSRGHLCYNRRLSWPLFGTSRCIR